MIHQGYSSLAIALVLPKGGRLVACERDAKSLEVAKRYYDLAGVSKKVCLTLAHMQLQDLLTISLALSLTGMFEYYSSFHLK